MTEPSTLDFAAVDLGSNSFHMVIARADAGQLRVLDRLREPVSLGSGLDSDNQLSDAARERALACLARFSQRLRTLPQRNVRAVGTKTLRRARDASRFIEEAETVLGHRIDIITGQEEARLVYHGVRASGEMPGQAPHLVIDIGGASTEIAIGEAAQPALTESISAGCVVATQRHFPDGRVTAETWQRARNDVLIELLPLLNTVRNTAWHTAIGSSGSIKAIAAHAKRQGLSNGETITASALAAVCDSLLSTGTVDAACFEGLSDSRRRVFAGGAVVLSALFSALKISTLRVSQAALREGVLYELFGQRDADVQRQTVQGLQRRFGIDTDQAERVGDTVSTLMGRVREAWPLPDRFKRVARQAASLHEIGLAVSHSQFHKHGEMLLRHADMPGFSNRQQAYIATLVRMQRKRCSPKLIPPLISRDTATVLRVAVLLRLSLILCRDRRTPDLSHVAVVARADTLTLQPEQAWMDDHPLTRDELEREVTACAAAGIELSVEPR
ncbi:MAG: Ppx/GppA phosphatase family protein [Pseudomonadota bacterium]